MSWHARAESEDEVRTWIVVLERQMSYEEACELGKVLGRHGYTGNFVNGSLAVNVSLIPKLKAEIKRLKGGE